MSIKHRCPVCEETNTYLDTDIRHYGIQCVCPCGHTWTPLVSVKDRRPNWDEYFMTLAVVTSTRATCNRRHVGCIIVSKTNQVLSTGYNGSAPGAAHCDDIDHLMHDGHCVRTIHAEANAVAQAAKNGISLSGSRIYVTTHPCPTCLLLLASAGVKDIIHLEAYHAEEDDVSTKLANDAAIIIKKYEGRELWTSAIER